VRAPAEPAAAVRRAAASKAGVRPAAVLLRPAVAEGAEAAARPLLVVVRVECPLLRSKVRALLRERRRRVPSDRTPQSLLRLPEAPPRTPDATAGAPGAVVEALLAATSLVWVPAAVEVEEAERRRAKAACPRVPSAARERGALSPRWGCPIRAELRLGARAHRAAPCRVPTEAAREVTQDPARTEASRAAERRPVRREASLAVPQGLPNRTLTEASREARRGRVVPSQPTETPVLWARPLGPEV
jgi:hypothetical protein